MILVPAGVMAMTTASLALWPTQYPWARAHVKQRKLNGENDFRRAAEDSGFVSREENRGLLL